MSTKQEHSLDNPTSDAFASPASLEGPEPPPRLDLNEPGAEPCGPQKLYFNTSYFFGKSPLRNAKSENFDDPDDDDEFGDDSMITQNAHCRNFCLRICETLVHVIGFYLFLVYFFALWRANAFFFNELAKDMVVWEEFDFEDSQIQKGFLDIGSTEEFFQWLHGPLINGLFGNTRLDLGDGVLPPAPDSKINYTEPFVYPNGTFYPFGKNLLVSGRVQLRQWRSIPNECRPHKGHKLAGNPPMMCFDGYVKQKFFDAYDDTPFGPAGQYKYDPNVGFEVHDGWLVESAPDGYYPKGGFAETLAGNSVEYVRAQVDALEANGWVDAQTVAVSIEFTIFNSMINNFVSAFMLVEWPRTGGAVPYFKIKALSLFEYNDDCWPTRPANIMLLATLLVLWIVFAVLLPHIFYFVRRLYGSLTHGPPVVLHSSHFYKVRWTENGQDVEAVFPFSQQSDIRPHSSATCSCLFGKQGVNFEKNAQEDLRFLLARLNDSKKNSKRRKVFACHEACRKTAFKAFDVDQDGLISRKEFIDEVEKWQKKHTFTREEIDARLNEIDINQDGYLSRQEFERAGHSQDFFNQVKAAIVKKQKEMMGMDVSEEMLVENEVEATCSWTCYWTDVNFATSKFVYASKSFPYRPLSANQVADVVKNGKLTVEEGLELIFGRLSFAEMRAAVDVFSEFVKMRNGNAMAESARFPRETWLEFADIIRNEHSCEWATREGDITALSALLEEHMLLSKISTVDHPHGSDQDSYERARVRALDHRDSVSIGMLYYDSWIIVDAIVLLFAFWAITQALDRLSLECNALTQMRTGTGFVSLYPIVVLQGKQSLSFVVLTVALTVRTFKYFLFFGKYAPELQFYLRAIVATIMPTLYFVAIFLVVSLGFAAAGHMLFKSNVQGYRTLAGSIFMNFRALLGDIDLSSWEYADRTNARVFFFIYTSGSVIFLFNLAIGILSEAFANKSEILREQMEEEKSREVAKKQSEALIKQQKQKSASRSEFAHWADKIGERFSNFIEAVGQGNHSAPVSAIHPQAHAVPSNELRDDDDDVIASLRTLNEKLKELESIQKSTNR